MKQTIVLIPGLSCSKDAFGDQLAVLERNEVNIVTILAGETDNVDDEVISIAESIKKYDRPIVVGFSLGANLATKLAHDFPDTVGTLMLIAGGSLPMDMGSIRYFQHLYNNFNAGLISREAIIEEWTNRFFSARQTSLRFRYKRMVATVDDKRLMNQMKLLICGNTENLTLDRQVLIVDGRHDAIISLERKEKNKDAFPKEKTRHIWLDAKHFMPWEKSEVITDMIRGCLQHNSSLTSATTVSKVLSPDNSAKRQRLNHNEKYTTNSFVLGKGF